MRDQYTGEPLLRPLLERIELQFRPILTEQLDLVAKAHTATVGEGHAAAQFTIDEPSSIVRPAFRSPFGRQSSVERPSGESSPDQLQFGTNHVHLSGSVLISESQQELNTYSSLPSEHHPVRLQSSVSTVFTAVVFTVILPAEKCDTL